jgi:POT family proton-dependent oligopeptide transporter
MMGVWLATSFIGNFLAGYLGTFWSRLDRVPFFLMLAVIAAAAGAVIALLDRPLRKVLHD